MAHFLVRFRDANDDCREVVLTCPSEDQARRFCAARGYTIEFIKVGRPRTITTVKSDPPPPPPETRWERLKAWWGSDRLRVSSRDLSLAFSQMSWMMSQGIPVHVAMRTVTKACTEDLATVLFTVIRRVESGTTLSQAMSHYRDIFPDYICSAIRIGEESGRLSDVLERLAAWLEKGNDFRNRLMSALIYPAVILLVCGLMGGFMLTVMLPQIIGSLQIPPQDTPLLTRVLMFIATSPWVRLLGVLAGLGALVGWFWMRSSPARAQRASQVLYKLPVLGRPGRSIALSNWLERVSLLLTSGIDLYHTLRLTSQGLTGPTQLVEAVTQLADHIRKGATLSVALSAHPDVFSRALISLTACAEEVGGIEASLRRYGEMLETDTMSRLDQALSLLEPLIMAAMGLIVGTLVVAIFLPLYARLG